MGGNSEMADALMMAGVPALTLLENFTVRSTTEQGVMMRSVGARLIDGTVEEAGWVGLLGDTEV